MRKKRPALVALGNVLSHAGLCIGPQLSLEKACHRVFIDAVHDGERGPGANYRALSVRPEEDGGNNRVLNGRPSSIAVLHSRKAVSVEESLNEQFFASLPPSARIDASDAGRVISLLLGNARASWPDIELDAAIFVRHLARCVGAEPSPLRALEAIRASELYLACACGDGNARAVAHLQKNYLHEVGTQVAHIDASAAFADEVRQLLLEKLIVAERASPKILEYRGRGSLAGWTRIAAIRIALNLRRGEKRHAAHHAPLQGSGEVGEICASSDDPELSVLKDRHREDFRAALQSTLAALSSDKRAVLRMHYLDGLSVDEISVGYRVHRTTVTRWIEATRRRIVVETLRLLQERLQLRTPAEAESLARLVQSELDLSLLRILGPASD